MVHEGTNIPIGMGIQDLCKDLTKLTGVAVVKARYELSVVLPLSEEHRANDPQILGSVPTLVRRHKPGKLSQVQNRLPLFGSHS